MNELEWLTERRPEGARRGSAASRARAALLAHATCRGCGDAARRAPRRQVARRTRRRPADLWPRSKAGLYTLAAAVFAVAIVIAAGALPSGDGPRASPCPRRPPRRRWCGSPRASRPSRRRPATRRSSCAATRSRTTRGSPGADLYLDDGRYFYAQTRAGLRDAAPQEEFGQRQIAAAKAAVELPAAQARKRMIAATWGPEGEPAEQCAAREAPGCERDRRRPPRRRS